MSVDIQGAEAARAFDLLALPEGYFQDPYPWFKLLRDHDPMHPQRDGSLLLTRHEDVRIVWKDLTGVVDRTAMFREKWGEGGLLEHYTTGFLFRDPPDHDRMRKFANPFFFPDNIARQRPFIEAKVEELLDEAAERKEFDFLHEFAARLPIAVICKILGVPQSEAPIVQDLGRRSLVPLNARVTPEIVDSGNRAIEHFKQLMGAVLDELRSRRELDAGADLASALVQAERDGADLSEQEILHMCMQILTGGHETTTNLLATSMHALIHDPETMAQLREEPTLIRTGIEELVRFVTPLQFQGRRTTRDVTIPSGTIPAGTEVMFCQASANRDERVFAEPERLNLKRWPNQHLAFGAGLHVCIGQPLARLEVGIAIPAFVRRFGSIEMTGPAVFNPNPRFRGLDRLPVRVR